MADTAKELMGECPENLEQAILRATALCYNGSVDTDFWDSRESYFTAELHHSLGQHMRNYWGLWSHDSLLYKDLANQFFLSHADDMSGLIILGMYRHHNDIELNLENYAAKCLRHWGETLINKAYNDGPFEMSTEEEEDDDIPY